jgi:tetratricopeptide (TPR) repeat protein
MVPCFFQSTASWTMDPDNPVVKLCAEGMHAEMSGRNDEAKRLYEQAWAVRESEFDACIAAHYVARQQTSDEEAFRWNKEALARASVAAPDLVKAFYASLYLNMGHSHEKLGDLAEARRFFELAEDRLGDVPDGPYRNVVRGGIANGLARTDNPTSKSLTLPARPAR